MIIPLAKCTSFPAFLQRWLSSLLIPCCSFNVKNLFVLILLSFLATFSIVSLWHLFPPWLPWRHAILGFLLLLWLLFYWFFFICCSHFPLSSIFKYASEIYFGRSYLLPPQGLSTDLFTLPGFLLTPHLLSEAYPDPHYPSHIPDFFFFP